MPTVGDSAVDRVTAPMQPFTARAVRTGVLVAGIGILVTIGIPLLVT